MIPRVFHFVWVGGVLPAELAAHVATWPRVNPGWEIQFWTDDDFDGWLVNQDLFDDAERYTPHVGQFRADVARYEILHRFGGIYVDVDFEARKPIDSLLGEANAVAAWETDGVWINNAFLGAIAGHSLFGDLIAGLHSNIARHAGKRPNVMTGPQYLTPIGRRHIDLRVFPSALFYPYSWSELERAAEEFTDAYAVHHWNNRRTRDRKALPCPATS